MAWGTTSRQSRGYGPAWDRVRKIVMDRDKWLCQPSLKKGLIVRATEVDHIVSKAKAKRMGWSDARIDHPDNLQAISKEAHLQKTREEVGATYRPKVQIGPDGWPIK